jgi:hypothetical protein
MTLGELLARYCTEITPTKRSASTESARLKALMTRDICHRTLAKLASSDLAGYRDLGDDGRPISTLSAAVRLTLTEVRTQRPCIQRISLTTCSNESKRPSILGSHQTKPPRIAASGRIQEIVPAHHRHMRARRDSNP